jgi:hypothetical protein
MAALGAALVLGASVMGILAGLCGMVVLPQRLVLPLRLGISLTVLVAGYAEAEQKAIRAPASKWRVPKRWLAAGPTCTALLFGFTLGVGFLTAVPFIGYHVLILLCMLSRSPWAGGALGLTFGAARAGATLLTVIGEWRNHAPGVCAADNLPARLQEAYHAGRLWRASTLIAAAGCIVGGFA